MEGKDIVLTAIKMAYMLDSSLSPIPTPKNNDTKEFKKQWRKRKEDEVLCCGNILDTHLDHLYDVYESMKTPKEI